MAVRDAKDKGGIKILHKIKANTKIEEGHQVSVDAAGYAIPAADTASTIVEGIATETVDNTGGADGAKSVLVRMGCTGWVDNDPTNPIVQASVGSSAEVKTSASVCVAAGSTNHIKAGTVLKLDATLGVLVYFPIGAKR